jgi:hypothetical protein
MFGLLFSRLLLSLFMKAAVQKTQTFPFLVFVSAPNQKITIHPGSVCSAWRCFNQPVAAGAGLDALRGDYAFQQEA